jgi:hypothetical protein
MEARYINLLGRSFGDLRLVRLSDNRGAEKRREGDFICTCGRLIGWSITRVFRGYKSHCGCKTDWRTPHIKHGMRRTPEYSSWVAMKRRCQDSGHKDYPNYGARGIYVCARWQSFDEFFADMGRRPTGTSLDRIDNEDGYHPGNCRWANDSAQQRNRRGSHQWEVRGQRFDTLREAAEHFGVTATTVHRWVRNA